MANIRWNTRRLSPEEQNPYSNLLSQAMQSYNAMTDTQYHEPQLREALKKSQLYNQYYGRDKESQIGLRGSQAGHLNSMTQGQNLTNQDMPKIFMEAHQAAQLKAKYPFLSVSGLAGDIQRMMYFKELKEQHPERFAAMQEQQQEQQLPQQQSNGDSVPGITQQEQMDSQSPGLIGSPKQQEQESLNPEQEAIQQSSGDKSNNHDLLSKLQESIENHGKPKEQTDIAKQKSIAYQWDHGTPLNVKQYQLAQVAGAGVLPDKAISDFRKGISVDQILEREGFDPKNPPDLDYLPANGDFSRINTRKSALAELKYISNYVTESVGENARTIMGYSTNQFTNLISGFDKKKQAKFLAARALIPEQTNLRLLTSGAKGTVHAIKAMQDAALSNIKIFRASVDPDTWKEAQKETDRVLSHAMNRSINAYTVANKKNKISKELEKDDYSKMSDEELRKLAE